MKRKGLQYLHVPGTSQIGPCNLKYDLGLSCSISKERDRYMLMSNQTKHHKTQVEGFTHHLTHPERDVFSRSGGHPRTHSGVTSTHKHNFASFFPPRVTRAHRLESRAHTAIFQSHPRTQTGVTSAHRHNFASFFPPRVTRAHITWDRVGWGGVGMMTFFCTCTHVQSAAQ